jgi:hypothetical protein
LSNHCSHDPSKYPVQWAVPNSIISLATLHFPGRPQRPVHSNKSPKERRVYNCQVVARGVLISAAAVAYAIVLAA